MHLQHIKGFFFFFLPFSPESLPLFKDLPPYFGAQSVFYILGVHSTSILHSYCEDGD